MPDWWWLVTPTLAVLLGLLAAVHAIRNKRDSRTALMWVALVMLSPFVGALLYYLFGINRIQRHASRIRAEVSRLASRDEQRFAVRPGELEGALGYNLHLLPLPRVTEQITARPLLRGNRIELLLDGDEAFPPMLEAIEGAERTISLASYIFDADATGRRFVEALRRARGRGVEVRVLIDAAGVRYSQTRITSLLSAAGVRNALFHPRPLFLRSAALNLRNHRKILVVDGNVGFTGGLNLRQRHVLADPDAPPVRDAHFRVVGPIVGQLQEVFAEDWDFAAGEALRGEAWFPSLREEGATIARAISAGPDAYLDALRWTLLAAIGAARHSIRILTPYFVPDQNLVTALGVAAMRGVEVDILVPERGNIPVARWAMRAMLDQFLQRGCRVWLTPDPFDHAKLMVVDRAWAKVGSANWDARSLRLNFELDIEVYDADFAGCIEDEITRRRESARRLSAEELNARPELVKLRDGVARLFSGVL